MLLQLAVDIGQFRPQLALPRRELGLLDRPVQEDVHESVEAALGLAAQLGQHPAAVGVELRHISEGGLQGVADEVGVGLVVDAQGFQLRHHGVIQFLRRPAHHRVAGWRIVVRAPVVVVDHLPSALPPPDDALAGHHRPAQGTAEEAALIGQFGRPCAAVLPLQDVLAEVEGLPRHQRSELGDVGDAPADDLADVGPVVEDVGQGGAVEPVVGLAEGMPFGEQLVPQGVQGVVARGEEIEDAHHGLGLLRVRDHRAGLVGRVLVAEAGPAHGPALADLLLHTLEDLGAQVVAVILRHRGHHVERQSAARAGAELVVDEGQFDPAFVLQALEPDRVLHVATDAVQLVSQDGMQAFFAGVAPDPVEHLVEGLPLGPALGRLGNLELAHHLPALPLGALPAGSNLGVDGVALALLAGTDPGPDDDLHGRSSSRAA